MKLDFETSTVTIGGRRFPAVGLLCPEEANPPSKGRWDRVLGGPSDPTVDLPANVSVYVPLENGLLVDVEEGRGPGPGLYVMLYSWTCELSHDPNSSGDWLWSPVMLAKVGKQAVRNRKPEPNRLGIPYPRELWTWADAEEEWVAEHLDRLSRLEVVALEGPRVTLIHLRETWELCAEGYKNRAGSST